MISDKLTVTIKCLDLPEVKAILADVRTSSYAKGKHEEFERITKVLRGFFSGLNWEQILK